jgi:uncharacterized protein
MALLDVNALVALVWDSHVHHVAVRRWFAENAPAGWATCPLTESGFVRVSSNPRVLPVAVTIADARAALSSLRSASGHTFLVDDVSLADPDVPAIHGYRQVTDVHLLTLARRHGRRLVTFDAAMLSHDRGVGDVELLTSG